MEIVLPTGLSQFLDLVIVQFTSNDMPLDQLMTIPGGGMGGNRVVPVDGSLSSLIFNAQEVQDFGGTDEVYFSELEFNVAKVMGAPDSIFSLVIIDQFGNAFQGKFDDSIIAPGPNVFSVQATGGSLIDSAILTSSLTNIRDVRQLRVTVAPEPSTCALISLLTLASFSRRRRK